MDREPEPDVARTEAAVESAAARSTSLIVIAVLASLYTLYFARAFFVPIVFAVLLSFLLSPAPAPELNKEVIVKIRSRLNASQKVFADVLNVSIGTVRSWEQGLRVPDGPSKRLLEVAYRHPEIILESARVAEPSRAKSHYVKAPVSATDRRTGTDRRASTASKK